MIEEIKKSISDLGGVHIVEYIFRFELLGGQRMDIDMSLCPIDSQENIVRFLMESSYRKGLEDGGEGEMTVYHHYYNDTEGSHIIPPKSANLSL